MNRIMWFNVPFSFIVIDYDEFLMNLCSKLYWFLRDTYFDFVELKKFFVSRTNNFTFMFPPWN